MNLARIWHSIWSSCLPKFPLVVMFQTFFFIMSPTVLRNANEIFRKFPSIKICWLSECSIMEERRKLLMASCQGHMPVTCMCLLMLTSTFLNFLCCYDKSNKEEQVCLGIHCNREITELAVDGHTVLPSGSLKRCTLVLRGLSYSTQSWPSAYGMGSRTAKEINLI